MEDILEKIVKIGSKWQVQSEKGRNMGTYDTKAEAEERLKQVHYFKYANEALLEAANYKDTLWRYLKKLTQEEWQAFNSQEREPKITMTLPESIKELYYNELKTYLKTNGGWVSLCYYFDETTNSVQKMPLTKDINTHLHHIDFKEIVPERKFDVYNLIALDDNQHSKLHNMLKTAGEKYLRQHPDASLEERRAIGVCIGADKDLQIYGGTASTLEVSNSAKGLHAGVVDRTEYQGFSQDKLDKAKNSDYVKNMHGLVDKKEIYLFKGNMTVSTLTTDLKLEDCLTVPLEQDPNRGLPFISIANAAKAINRSDKILSTQATANSAIIKTGNADIGLHTTKPKDSDGKFISGMPIVPVYREDWDFILENKVKIESLLEDNRTTLINKSRNQGAYVDQSRGKNRFERKKYSKVANAVKAFNQIDMNDFFKQDILTVKVPVTGETNSYTVSIKMDGVVAEIAKNIKNNKNKLEFRTIIQALTKVFNTANIYVNCTCPDYRYNFDHWNIINNVSTSDTAHDPGPGKNIANPHDDKGRGCKHVLLVLNNGDWMMKVASVINNYIHYAEENMQKPFLKLIFPKLYGIPADEMVEQDLIDDEKFLDSSSGLIDAINEYGKTRGRYTKGTNKNPVTGTGGRAKKEPEKELEKEPEKQEEETPTE